MSPDSKLFKVNIKNYSSKQHTNVHLCANKGFLILIYNKQIFQPLSYRTSQVLAGHLFLLGQVLKKTHNDFFRSLNFAAICCFIPHLEAQTPSFSDCCEFILTYVYSSLRIKVRTLTKIVVKRTIPTQLPIQKQTELYNRFDWSKTLQDLHAYLFEFLQLNQLQFWYLYCNTGSTRVFKITNVEFVQINFPLLSEQKPSEKGYFYYKYRADVGSTNCSCHKLEFPWLNQLKIIVSRVYQTIL